MERITATKEKSYMFGDKVTVAYSQLDTRKGFGSLLSNLSKIMLG